MSPPEVGDQVTVAKETTEPHVLAIAPFPEWKYEDASKAMRDILPTDFTIASKYVLDKDHFQKGSEWVGPGDGTTNATIQKQFAPEDAIGEVLANVENAFSSPQLGGTPVEGNTATDEQIKMLTDELVSILTEWWNTQRMQEHVQDGQRTAAWAGWADLRLWIPWRFLIRQVDGSVTVQGVDSVEDALKFIHVMAPSPEYGAIVTDKGTQDKVAIFLDTEVEYKNGERNDYARAELMYLDPMRISDESADTIMRIVYADDKKASVTVRLPLGGRLMTTEMRARILITDPVMRTQRQLNLLTTVVSRLGETAAFRERYTINAKPQGMRYPYEDGEPLKEGAFTERDEEGHVWQVVPQPRTLGASTTTELVGLPKVDSVGEEKGFETPGVEVVDPVDPGPYLLAADSVRRRILRMCSQGHLGGVSNAESSGIAYEQARAVFEKDLEKRKTSQEGMLRELLTSALKLAENIANKPGVFTNTLRLTVEQNIDPGPRSPDLVRLDLEAYEAGVLSRATTMLRIGVEDTDAEISRIRHSAAHIMGILEQAMSVTAFTPESLIDVMRELGLPEDILGKLEVPEVVPPVVQLDPSEGE